MGVSTNRAALIDEYGELSRQLEEIQPVVARHKMIRSMIQSWFDSTAADEPVLLQGRRYTLQVSPRENATTLKSIRAIFREMGESKFLDHCSITLKAVKDCLGEAKFNQLTSVNRTGLRNLKTVAKAAIARVAA